MKILVFGGTSYIGSALISLLIKNGDTAINISRKEYKGIRNYPFDFNLDELIKNELPDKIIYFSTCFDNSDINAIVNTNILKPLETINIATQHKIKTFFIGSYWQFGDIKNTGIPIDLYSSSKKAFSSFIEYYNTYENANCTEIVLYGSYGVNDGRGKIIDLLIENTKNKIPTDLSKGEQQLNLSNVDNIVEVIYNILSMDNIEDKIEIKSSKNYTLNEIATIFINKYGSKINLGEKKYRKAEVFHMPENNYKSIYINDTLLEYIDRMMKNNA
ncbi:NAD-dependent epimerase/dehydratase family protein [Providencia alcalifaciens]|uniref:NAD-dependent epimerase/dehydratase family protein n=1 Tax=Providencia alcalifaciens TaxID=126385 RepID=UPI00044554A8|nr:NAD-dependent epimerase/dehydratase family protein [Providencia alcalifaciens]ETT07710.1 NAD dependent epimerase/dehydratase family protein [Providencia alcalifaciens F90-2004]EUC95030.1 NAD dependent epimerase/dehydratase family protein [Providencia alcalifaciens PAL-2]MTB33175.1 NAD-dependent epimerase/dehydratase family protein [Providencia alcalifaciens]MTC97588.1 NAD-dependent epimerase/dehydratase family protein [Providencia alcalifaciens]